MAQSHVEGQATRVLAACLVVDALVVVALSLVRAFGLIGIHHAYYVTPISVWVHSAVGAAVVLNIVTAESGRRRLFVLALVAMVLGFAATKARTFLNLAAAGTIDVDIAFEQHYQSWQSLVSFVEAASSGVYWVGLALALWWGEPDDECGPLAGVAVICAVAATVVGGLAAIVPWFEAYIPAPYVIHTVCASSATTALAVGGVMMVGRVQEAAPDEDDDWGHGRLGAQMLFVGVAASMGVSSASIDFGFTSQTWEPGLVYAFGVAYTLALGVMVGGAWLLSHLPFDWAADQFQQSTLTLAGAGLLMAVPLAVSPVAGRGGAAVDWATVGLAAGLVGALMGVVAWMGILRGLEQLGGATDVRMLADLARLSRYATGIAAGTTLLAGLVHWLVQSSSVLTGASALTSLAASIGIFLSSLWAASAVRRGTPDTNGAE